MKSIIFLLVAIFLIGCGVTKTTTTTEAIKIPAVVIHKTDTLYLVLKKEGYGFVSIDSLKQWTLENLCHGELIIDTLGLKAKFTYSWKRIVSSLTDSLNNQIRMNQILKADLEKKKQEIEATKTVKETTPGDLWIFFHSAKFWIPSFILGIILGIIGFIFLHAKLKVLSKFIP
jgi:hypothetical protein